MFNCYNYREKSISAKDALSTVVYPKLNINIVQFDMLVRNYNYLYHGVQLRQRVHTVTISHSAVIHAERLPIEPRPTAHTVGYRRESSRLQVSQQYLSNSS